MIVQIQHCTRRISRANTVTVPVFGTVSGQRYFGACNDCGMQDGLSWTNPLSAHRWGETHQLVCEKLVGP